MSSWEKTGVSQLLCALLLAACTEVPEVEAIPDDRPPQPEVVTEGSRAERESTAAPTLANSLGPGECLTQDDCDEGEVCVATAPGRARCMAMEGVSVPPRAPNGRPAPPVGLLDGQMMRAHAQGSAR